MGAYLKDIIIYSQFRINQLRGFDYVRGRILPFPVEMLDAFNTVLHYHAVRDITPWPWKLG